MNTIFILAPWSSGSTAVSGYLSRAGAYDCPPHISTNDERTPNSHEPKELLDILKYCIHEQALKDTNSYRPIFRVWVNYYVDKQRLLAKENGSSCVVIKHPLLAFFIEEISVITDKKFIIVRRELSDIENTRTRRGWAPNYGKIGAAKIYGQIEGALLNEKYPTKNIEFSRFRSDFALRKELLNFCDLSPSSTKLKKAELWVK